MFARHLGRTQARKTVFIEASGKLLQQRSYRTQSSTNAEPDFSHLINHRPNMATPTSVDQPVQRDQPLPDQADPPGSPLTQDLAGEANENKVVNDGFGPSSGPDTPDATAEFSTLSLSIPHLSLSSSTSSPHTSSNEDSPQEASSSTSSSDYDYDSDSSNEEDDAARSDDGGGRMPEGMPGE